VALLHGILFSKSANNVQQRLKPTVWKNEGFKHKSKGAKTKNKLIKDEPNLYSTNLLVLKFFIKEKKTIKSKEKETL